MTAVLICAVVALILIAVILAVIIYNQMLLFNQVNKRLLLMTKESIEKERLTMEEVQSRLDEFENEYQTSKPQGTIENSSDDNDEPFDPHNFDTSTLE